MYFTNFRYFMLARNAKRGIPIGPPNFCLGYLYIEVISNSPAQ